ncbi:hypothetical protein PR202_ga25791 [Eleusine coracana subsp. coracana]|uniref:F-box domain-containing protein n=1 Tax=Eleusine coracana subsp. coracana TaxID=191504 RepID=A0AAV5DA84_ELECO|nr:hypothetical protein PR202_ga25791 [Eleusine coracana subsp. coracana]
MSAPELLDDLIGEVLLRFPPEEPELLVRAALVSKRWCRLISDPGFRRRFREFHRTPPMLGFFCIDQRVPRFVPTSSVRLPHEFRMPRDDRFSWCALDTRHGRVLLHRHRVWYELDLHQLVVWNPITDEQQEVPTPPIPPEHVYPYCCSWTAAVLCATAGGGCNNLNCHPGSFLVVFVCTGSRETFTCIYSSDSGAWSGPTSVQLRYASVRFRPSVLSENALYYVSDNCRSSKKILKVDLSTREASLIRLPRTPYKHIGLTAMVDGGLGFAAMHESKLHLWSMDPGSKAYAGWTHNRVFELDKLLGPIGNCLESIYELHFVDGIGALFIGTKDVFVMLDLKSFQIRKLYEGRLIYGVVPYMSFYTPGGA